jgi:hypothetical protein
LINFVSQLTANILNNLAKLETLKLDIGESIRKDEYNIESASEWVNPYAKLDPKTNRYRQVKGYYRKVN